MGQELKLLVGDKYDVETHINMPKRKSLSVGLSKIEYFHHGIAINLSKRLQAGEFSVLVEFQDRAAAMKSKKRPANF
ncbi:MAG: hypothetical protein ACRC5U_02820 [Plesiomonas sp.]